MVYIYVYVLSAFCLYYVLSLCILEMFWLFSNKSATFFPSSSLLLCLSCTRKLIPRDLRFLAVNAMFIFSIWIVYLTRAKRMRNKFNGFRGSVVDKLLYVIFRTRIKFCSEQLFTTVRRMIKWTHTINLKMYPINCEVKWSRIGQCLIWYDKFQVKNVFIQTQEDIETRFGARIWDSRLGRNSPSPEFCYFPSPEHTTKEYSSFILYSRIKLWLKQFWKNKWFVPSLWADAALRSPRLALDRSPAAFSLPHRFLTGRPLCCA